MSDYKIGYGKPPKDFQFKPGTSGNRRGRPKRKPNDSARAIFDVLNGEIEYREGGKVKKTTRLELSLQILIQRAMTDVAAAAALLRARRYAERDGNDTRSILVEVEGWLPEHDGQTAEAMTRRANRYSEPTGDPRSSTSDDGHHEET